MAIQKVNTSFGVTLKADYKSLIRTSVDAGLRDKGVKKALKIINDVCPKKDHRVYLYYNSRYKIGEHGNIEYAGLRSGVKIAKDGVVLEKNIDPEYTTKRNLLYKFAITVKKLVNGEIQPDETVKLFK